MVLLHIYLIYNLKVFYYNNEKEKFLYFTYNNDSYIKKTKQLLKNPIKNMIWVFIKKPFEKIIKGCL